mmetsp:Transcript_15836/g.23531  ORF Transcript_15836/g.23531 Transcript_15836/m.23531 type:complete len:150 (-) Transcript_15836:214-663(-)
MQREGLHYKTQSMLGPTTKRINSTKNASPRKIMLKGASHMKRNQKLSISPQSFMNAEALPRNGQIALLGFGRVSDAAEGSAEEGKALPAVVPHGDAGGGHDCHEGVERVVREGGCHSFYASCACHVSDVVLFAIDKTVRKPRSNQHARQ